LIRLLTPKHTFYTYNRPEGGVVYNGRSEESLRCTATIAR